MTDFRSFRASTRLGAGVLAVLFASCPALRAEDQDRRGQGRREGESAAPRRAEARRDEQRERAPERRAVERRTEQAPREERRPEARGSEEMRQRPPERRSFERGSERPPREERRPEAGGSEEIRQRPPERRSFERGSEQAPREERRPEARGSEEMRQRPPERRPFDRGSEQSTREDRRPEARGSEEIRQRPPERRPFERGSEQSTGEGRRDRDQQRDRSWSDRQQRRQEAFSQPGEPSVVRTHDGGIVRRDSVGHIREVRTPSGAIITHRPDGGRRVEVVRPGERVVVVHGRGHGGYVQRPIVYSNHTYLQRTYYVRGVSYTRVYRPVVYRGIDFHIYTPVRYYHPSFYTWVWNPWPRPVVYRWGWESSPWYGYYGGYFVPYRTYPGPAFWLTDFVISTMLQEAYEERMAARAAAYRYDSQAVLTPEVKQAISDEVRRQLDQEQTQSSGAGASEAPPVFADGASHVFVVADRLEVTSQGGLGCTISEGDVLQLNTPPPSNLNAADVVVLASKSGDCRKGSVVSVPLQELQDMQNRMRDTVDRGLQDLQSRQGQSGIPEMPASAAGAVDSPLARNLQPETNVADELRQTEQEAARGEREVVDQSRSGAPVRISLGQSVDEVTATEGQPEKIVDLGAKKIYVYRDLKITFTDGRVTDVE